MVVYNAGSKELTAKIVYYGPGLGGKTTNLQFLHRRLEPSSVGNLLTLAATADRTIFFDLLPVELGDLKGYRIRFQVATVPGQAPYNETRRVVLRGVDGIVFVVDSRWSMLPKNLESFQNLKDNLKEEGVSFEGIPIVVQFNKRDLPDVLAVDALQEGLGLGSLPYIEAVASDGRGVVETFKLISKLTFVDILRRLQKKGIPRAPRQSTGAVSPAALKAVPDSGENAVLQDESATRAISIPPAFARPETASPRAPLESPFFTPDDTNPSLRIAAERQEAIIQETFAPFPELPPPLREDTNPSFYPSAIEPAAQSPTTTASFPAFEPEPPLAEEDPEITAPMNALEITTEPATSAPTSAEPWSVEALSFTPAAEEVPEEPEPLAWIPEPAAPPSSELSEINSRLERLGERLSKVEEMRPWSGEIDDLRASLADQKRGHEKASGDTRSAIDDLRTSVANQRLGHEKASGETRSEIDRLQREVAESSSREMELVAQVSRESLGVAASLEKLGFRIRETEEKFSQLAVDQESRLSRLERLFEETAEREIRHQEGHRRTVLELKESLQSARLEAQERLAGIETLRETLSSTLGDLAERLRRAVNASGAG